MSIEVAHLESWIGSEARGRSGEKLGKIDDVYFVGTDPVAIDIRSGLGGRKHHAATLTGASVSHDGIQLAIDEDELVSTDGGALTSGQISALYGQDERLHGAQPEPEQLESWHQREKLRQEAEEARANADKLEAEARRRAEEEEKAAALAGDAETAADKARREHEEAEARAREAKAAADPTQQS